MSKVTYVADIHAGYTNSTVVTYGFDHLVDYLTRVRLSPNHHLDPVHPALGIFTSRALYNTYEHPGK